MNQILASDNTTCWLKSCVPITFKYVASPNFPSQADWATLNDSLDGNLTAAVPIFQPCYLNGGNESQCRLIQEQVTTNNSFVEGNPVQD